MDEVEVRTDFSELSIFSTLGLSFRAFHQQITLKARNKTNNMSAIITTIMPMVSRREFSLLSVEVIKGLSVLLFELGPLLSPPVFPFPFPPGVINNIF